MPNIPTVAQIDGAKKKRVRNYKRHTTKLLSEEFPDIMQTLANKSKEGSLSHTKYLFEIGRVKEDIERQGQGSEPSLAELLLAEVRRRQAEVPSVESAVKASGDPRAEIARSRDERGGDCGATE